MELECRDCGVKKAAEQMSKWGGNPTDLCEECREKRRLARKNSKENGAATTRKKAKTPARKKPPEPESLLVKPGLGFKAYLTDDDRLAIEQENDGAKPDCVVLSKTETKAISAQFAEWCNAAD